MRAKTRRRVGVQAVGRHACRHADGVAQVSTPHLSASIMCASLVSLEREIHELEEAGLDSIHVDVMDAHFVPNLTFGTNVVEAIRSITSLPLHVHLMVADPGFFAAPMAEAGCNVYIFHLEAERYPFRLLDRVRELGMSPGVALNPATPVELAQGLDVEHLLVMTVEPGFAGQRWLAGSERRVARARRLMPASTVIGVDGNVSKTNAVRAMRAGASLLVCGTSSLFGTGLDYRSAICELRASLAASTQGTPTKRQKSG